MDEYSQFGISNQSQIKPPAYQFNPNPFLLVILFVLLSFLLLLIFFFFFLQKKVNPKPKSSTLVNLVSPTGFSNSVLPTNPAVNLTIAYLKEGNVWLLKADGTGLRQLTRDASEEVKYKSLVFLGSNELGFLRCNTSSYQCTIKLKNLITNQEEEILTREEMIEAFAIDKSKKLKAFLQQEKVGNLALYYIDDQEEKKIFDFPKPLGRGGGLKDEVSLAFSPNEQYLLVVNTFSVPNQTGNPWTIWLFDRFGKLVETVGEKFATDAFWQDNSRFIYSEDGWLITKTIGKAQENFGQFAGYDLVLSPDRTSLLGWQTTDQGETTCLLYSLADQSVQEIVKNLSYPRWLDEQNIIAIKTLPNESAYYGFTTTGLVKYNLESRTESILDSHSSISQFTIQPF